MCLDRYRAVGMANERSNRNLRRWIGEHDLKTGVPHRQLEAKCGFDQSRRATVGKQKEIAPYCHRASIPSVYRGHFLIVHIDLHYLSVLLDNDTMGLGLTGNSPGECLVVTDAVALTINRTANFLGESRLNLGALIRIQKPAINALALLHLNPGIRRHEILLALQQQQVAGSLVTRAHIQGIVKCRPSPIGFCHQGQFSKIPTIGPYPSPSRAARRSARYASRLQNTNLPAASRKRQRNQYPVDPRTDNDILRHQQSRSHWQRACVASSY